MMTSTVDLAVVIGAATSPGRLHAAASYLATDAAAGVGQVRVVDLSVEELQVADGRPLAQCDDRTRAAVNHIDGADAVIIASPVYRASYPGVLKNLLDLLPLGALRAKPVGALAMGASSHHYLAVDTQLRSVLSWFGAVMLPTSLYLTGADFDDDGQPLPSAQDDLTSLWRGTVDIALRLQGASVGLSPLAAKGG